MDAAPAARLISTGNGAHGGDTLVFAGDVAVTSLRHVCPTVLTPADEKAYDAARTCWNRDSTGRPALIAQPADATQVRRVNGGIPTARVATAASQPCHNRYAQLMSLRAIPLRTPEYIDRTTRRWRP